MEQNCKLWVPSIYSKIQDLEGFFKHYVFFYWTLPLVKVSARPSSVWGVRAQKTLKRGHFMDAESIQKTFNFATTYAILMKLTTDIYLNKVFHLAKYWGTLIKRRKA